MRHHTARLRWGALALAVLLALSTSACGDDDGDGDDSAGGSDGTTQTTAADDGGGGGGGAGSVEVADFAFAPDSIEVAVGDEVTWTNADETTHTVTADDGSFDHSVDASASVTQSFTEAGEVAYHCEIHSSMTGTVVVTEG